MADLEDDRGFVHYDTWSTRNGDTTGYVAVYTDTTGQYVKIVHNGKVVTYERIGD